MFEKKINKNDILIDIFVKQILYNPNICPFFEASSKFSKCRKSKYFQKKTIAKYLMQNSELE